MASRRTRLSLTFAAPILLGFAALGVEPPTADPPVCPFCGGSFEEFVAKFEATLDVSTRILVHTLVR